MNSNPYRWHAWTNTLMKDGSPVAKIVDPYIGAHLSKAGNAHSDLLEAVHQCLALNPYDPAQLDQIAKILAAAAEKARVA